MADGKKTASDHSAAIAGGRAGLYGLLVGVFGCLPDGDLVGRIRAGELKGLLDQGRSIQHSGFQAGLRLVDGYLERLASRSDEEIVEELSIDRTRIVRAPGRMALRPPYEGLYTTGDRTGNVPLEVKRFYRKAGMLPEDAAAEPPDYLCMELDFMKNLCLREQAARSAGHDVSGTIGLQKAFLEEHLGGWVGRYCARAADFASTDFYRGFLSILDAVVGMDMEYLAGAA